MVTLENAKFAEKQDIFGKLVRLADSGSRDIVTLEKNGKFLGIFSYEGYACKEFSVSNGSLDSGKTRYLIVNSKGKIVFHARSFYQDGHLPKPTNPIIEESYSGINPDGGVVHSKERSKVEGLKRFSRGGLELLKLKRGDWLKYLTEADNILCKDDTKEEDTEEYWGYLGEENQVSEEKTRNPIEILKEKFPLKPMDFRPLLSELGMN